jgi:hypothetical protein
MPDDRNYEQLFVYFSKIVEKYLIRIAMGLFILLFIAQAALQVSSIRPHLSKVERMEGISVHLQGQNDR